MKEKLLGVVDRMAYGVGWVYGLFRGMFLYAQLMFAVWRLTRPKREPLWKRLEHWWLYDFKFWQFGTGFAVGAVVALASLAVQACR